MLLCVRQGAWILTRSRLGCRGQGNELVHRAHLLVRLAKEPLPEWGERVRLVVPGVPVEDGAADCAFDPVDLLGEGCLADAEPFGGLVD